MARALALLLVAACAVASAPFPTGEVSVDGTVLTVWVADSAEERRQGLREVTDLPVDGMLFVFPGGATPAFIMEDTLIPLDLWFFDVEGRLVEGVEMVPCATDPCPLYPAPEPVGWALETPAGAYRFGPGAELVTSP